MTQRFVYELIGANGDHIYFDNNSFAVMSEGLEGFSGHPAELNLISTPGEIGELAANSTIKKRTLSMKLLVMGNGRAELDAKRLRLIKALNPINGASRLIWNREDGLSLGIDVYPDSNSPEFRTGTLPDARSWECYLDLIAPDPCWQSMTAETTMLRGFVGGWSLPMSLPVSFGGVGTTLTMINPGDTPSPCEITLRGFLETPVIQNLITGESITVKRTIRAGEILTINTAHGNRSVTLTDIYGNVTNALHYVTISSTFFQIPSGNVKVTYSATDEGSGAVGYISYTPRWLSV